MKRIVWCLRMETFGLNNLPLHLSLFLSLHSFFVLISGEVFWPLFYFSLSACGLPETCWQREVFTATSVESEKYEGNRTMLDAVTHLGEVGFFQLSKSGKFQPC